MSVRWSPIVQAARKAAQEQAAAEFLAGVRAVKKRRKAKRAKRRRAA